MKSVQSEHPARHRFPLHAQGNTYRVLALAKKPQLIVPSALLCFKLQDFGLKGLFSGNSLIFYLVDLDEWEKLYCLNYLTTTKTGCLEQQTQRRLINGFRDWMRGYDYWYIALY